MVVVAALFVDPRGGYGNLEGVDCWGQERDARLYGGPHPVVAHPPCSCWCRLAGLVEARWGHKRGEDGGCFASALESVRRWGGVVEHPAHSGAWIAFGLSEPPREGGWLKTFCGGWVCAIEQGRYGHRARKSTWLYAHGTQTPKLLWGATGGFWPASWHHSKRDAQRPGYVSWCANHGGENIPRIGKKEAAHTPEAFRDVLLEIARSARLKC